MLCFSGIRKGKLTFCVQVLSIDLFKSKNLNLKLLRKTRNYSMICFFILFYLLRKLECATFSLFSLFFTFLRVSIFPNFFMYFFTFSIFLINFVFFSFLCITLCKKIFSSVVPWSWVLFLCLEQRRVPRRHLLIQV